MDILPPALNEPGWIRWLVDALVLPVLVVALVYGVRWAYLRIVVRASQSEETQEAHRQISRVVALVASVAAVILVWRLRLEELLGRTDAPAERREVLLDWLGGIVNLIIATAVLVLAILVMNAGARYGEARFHDWKEARKGVKVQGAVLMSPFRVRQFAVFAMKVARVVAVGVLLYAYVPLVLTFIPVTRPLSGRVVPVVLDPVRDLGLGFVNYLPRLLSLIVILIVVRLLFRFVGFLMTSVERGTIRVPGFDPEWADQTGRLARIILVLGTVMIVYPFLPGAGSEVFKGFSLFIGALFTFGASSSVSNLISGIILTYNRSFRLGDRIQIGGTTGDVITRGLFVTRLRTITNEEVMVPNNVALSGQVVNFSAGQRNGGVVVTVAAGIGYDVDWRRVHELMKAAAADTELVLDDPEPIVLQRALGDFAVSYELRAWIADPTTAPRAESDLRQHVLDRFHEAGVEIMTPVVNAIRNAGDRITPGDATTPDAETATSPTSAVLRFLGIPDPR